MKRSVLAILVVVITLVLSGAAFLYSGLYNIAADEKHWDTTAQLMQTARLRSIGRHARDIKPPSLDDPQLTLKGAGQYAEMCVMCHLAPGLSETPLRQGLYPQPPDLSQQKVDAATSFWVIKHGVKMSGMAAWGASHDDETLWSIVACLQKLPGLSPQQYKERVDEAPPDAEMSSAGGRSEHGSSHHAHTHSHKKAHDK